MYIHLYVCVYLLNSIYLIVIDRKWVRSPCYQMCVRVYVCMYLPSYSIQGLRYTHVVLSTYLNCLVFSFNCCTLLAIITSSFNPLQVSLIRWGKAVLFLYCSSKFFFLFSCLLKYLASFYYLIFSVSFKSFINLYIVSLLFLFLLVLSVAFLLIFPYMLGFPNLVPSQLQFSVFL